MILFVRKTHLYHDSELHGQEAAGHTQQTSELFTCNIVQKLVCGSHHESHCLVI